MTIPRWSLTMYQLAIKVLKEIDSNFIGIFLYGSQNYNLHTSESDRDVIILLQENRVPKKEVKFGFGVAKIYTIKYFISRLQKGDMECYEILYTNHRHINPQYEKVFNDFITNFSEVINYDRIKLGLARKLSEHISNISWIPFNRDKEKYHRKRVYWSYRVYDQLKRIIFGERLETTFVYKESDRERVLKIKSQPNYLSLRELDRDLHQMAEELKRLPRLSADFTIAETECVSKFYNNISVIRQGGDVNG